MAVAGDIVVLEDGFQVDALVLDSRLVLFEDCINLVCALLSSQVLPAGKQGVSGSDGGDSSSRCLVNSRDREGGVYIGDEVDVPKEALRVRCLVLFSESFELVVGQSEVHAREDGLELGACHTTLSQPVKVAEEFLDSDALHDYSSLEPVFNVGWIITNINVSLSEAVVDNVEALGALAEERADLLGTHSNLHNLVRLRALSLILREHVLWPVHIFAEIEVVDLLGVATIAVTADNEVKHLLTGWHEVQALHYSEELLSRDVKLLRAVKVLETRLEEDPVGDHVSVESRHHVNHLALFLVGEHLFKFWVIREPLLCFIQFL